MPSVLLLVIRPKDVTIFSTPKKQWTRCRRVKLAHSEEGSNCDVAEPPRLSLVFSSRFCATVTVNNVFGCLVCARDLLLMLEPHSEGPALHYFFIHNRTIDDHQIKHMKTKEHLYLISNFDAVQQSLTLCIYPWQSCYCGLCLTDLRAAGLREHVATCL